MDILDVPMQENDADAKTVGGYLRCLLTALWRGKAGFCAKRPFGNSGWQLEVYTALVKAGVVKGELDEHGDLETIEKVDIYAADKLIESAIAQLK